MPRRELSSLQTVLFKFVFPALWVLVVGWDAKDDLTFLIIWAVGSTLILWLSVRLKRVEIESGNLYVSNYVREITIPLTDVEHVTEVGWINIQPVTIHLRRATDFGDKITFMPKARFFGLWSSHPVVDELIIEARRASGRASGA